MRGLLWMLSLLLVLPAQPADPPSAPAAGERIVPTLRILGTAPDGAAEPQAGAGTTLRVGETGYAYLGLGTFDGEGHRRGKLCVMYNGTRPPNRLDEKEELVARAPWVWWAKLRALRAPFGRIRIEASWERWESRREGEARVTASGTRTFTVDEGQSHVLDFVATLSGVEKTCLLNAVIEIEAHIREAPELEGRELDYELWWVHTDAEGRESRRRLPLRGAQGEEVAFRFEPVRRPVPPRYWLSPEGAEYEVVVEVLGSLRGRIRADGSIALSLGARRWHRVVGEHDPMRGGMGGGGRKTFSVQPGETVALDLPWDPEAYGDIVQRGAVRLPVGEHFTGHRDRLLLTVDHRKAP